MGIEHVRAEIDRMRVQVGRQRKDILQLHRAGISTASAELLLQRMLAKVDELCAERDRLRKEQGGPVKGKALGGRSSSCANLSNGTTPTTTIHLGLKPWPKSGT